jgi:phage baseplate assembly protein W
MSSPSDDFRGAGWAFPVQVAPRPAVEERPGEALPQPPVDLEPDHAIALSRYDQAVRESILLILGTARGERVMRPDFGCGIHDLVFATNDSVTAARVSHEIRESMIEWEPRAETVTIDVAPDPADESRLVISLVYRVRATNNVFNLVYPFYLQVGELAP